MRRKKTKKRIYNKKNKEKSCNKKNEEENKNKKNEISTALNLNFAHKIKKDVVFDFEYYL